MSASIPASIDSRKLSVLAASILLVNGLSRLVNIPSRGFLITIASVQWAVEISGRLLFMLLLAALVAAGAETILRTHPILSNQPAGAKPYSTAMHWILPCLTAFGGSAAISLLPEGPRWWLGLFVISALLVGIIASEFLVLDRSDNRREVSAFSLRILGLALLAIMMAAIHSGSTRIAMALPIIILSVTVIALRLLDLQSPRTRQMYIFSFGIGLIVGELALPLSFLPISSIVFSLVLVLATYTLLGFAQAILFHGLHRTTVYEFFLIDAVALLFLFIIP